MHRIFALSSKDSSAAGSTFTNWSYMIQFRPGNVIFFAYCTARQKHSDMPSLWQDLNSYKKCLSSMIEERRVTTQWQELNRILKRCDGSKTLHQDKQHHKSLFSASRFLNNVCHHQSYCTDFSSVTQCYLVVRSLSLSATFSYVFLHGFNWF